jgi:hypothetical protein
MLAHGIAMDRGSLLLPPRQPLDDLVVDAVDHGREMRVCGPRAAPAQDYLGITVAHPGVLRVRDGDRRGRKRNQPSAPALSGRRG